MILQFLNYIIIAKHTLIQLQTFIFIRNLDFSHLKFKVQEILFKRKAYYTHGHFFKCMLQNMSLVCK